MLNWLNLLLNNHAIMKVFFSLITACLLQLSCYAQGEQWTVRIGQNAKDVLGDRNIYKYPQFMQGIVYLKDGTASAASLNLNLFNGEMHFINLANDTMAVADEGNIKLIIIQNDTFYYSKVFVQLLHGNSEAKLGRIEAIKPVNFTKETAYEQTSSVSSVNSASYFYGNSQVAKLSQTKDVVLHKETVYFIGDRFNSFLPVTRKNIFRLFNSQKTAIDNYIKDNKIELNRQEDLLKLIAFIQTVR